MHWLAFYKFGEYIGVKYPKEIQKNLDLMVRIGSQCEWWWPYEGFCFVSEKPKSIKWDDNKRLHCEIGAAIEYEDGYSLYAWHGVTVPSEWIKDKGFLTPELALSQSNAEQRRCACEILGWNNILSPDMKGYKVINADAPHIGTLIQVDLPEAPAQWLIKYRCGTGREFAEIINDKRYDTALKANAAGNGWRPEFKTPPEMFIPMIRS